MLDWQEDRPVVWWWRNQHSGGFGVKVVRWSPPASSALRCWRCSTSKHWGLRTGWEWSPPMTRGATHQCQQALARRDTLGLPHTDAQVQIKAKWSKLITTVGPVLADTARLRGLWLKRILCRRSLQAGLSPWKVQVQNNVIDSTQAGRRGEGSQLPYDFQFPFSSTRGTQL